jgi:sigma-B regulation protein RsbU (phosphoserine phosphatase)
MADVSEFVDLFENAPCGYVILDRSGRIERVNKTLCHWLGRTADQLVTRQPHDLLNVPGRIFYETHIAPLLRMQGFFNEVALDLISASGERIAVIANAVEHRNLEGRPEHTRIAFLKAADRRRYESELLSARDTARLDLNIERQQAELREQFVAILGHDLRNPLASISAGARILSRRPKDETETRVLVMMQAAVLRMSGLINNVMDFTRGRLGGGIALERNANEPLEPVLHQVVEELRAGMSDRVIEECYDIKSPVNCDRARLGQLLSNLLGNALVHGSANHPVRVDAITAGDWFELAVTNRGETISEAVMKRLFQPFFRGEVRASKQGLGLGLYIASEIARAHGGALTAESTKAETRFTFRMPCDDFPAAARQE